ncbi:hypothetical protein AMTR_s00011p00204820 [Amborella trichopoda]|uniref:Uncharacterized protein n=1 Tax=Amborella trichopoda TaxID=13333 RepID=W1NGN2_AMBTC|nr:hypothetical protein AMTR_s00011p00204820 [Amborella trichopoda]
MHLCAGGIGRVHQPLTLSYWVASKIKDRLNDMPNLTPEDVVYDIQRDHGIMLSYQQAWQGKEFVQEINEGSHTKEYKDLAKYLHKIRITILETVMIIQTVDLDGFERVFIGNHPCLYSFIFGYRPLMGLDETFLREDTNGYYWLQLG